MLTLCFQCRDTHWGWPLSTTIYLTKRIHSTDQTFEMRMNLAVIDWYEEGMQHALLSIENTPAKKRLDWCTPMKALVKKLFHFIGNGWFCTLCGLSRPLKMIMVLLAYYRKLVAGLQTLIIIITNWLIIKLIEPPTSNFIIYYTQGAHLQDHY